MKYFSKFILFNQRGNLFLLSFIKKIKNKILGLTKDDWLGIGCIILIGIFFAILYAVIGLY